MDEIIEKLNKQIEEINKKIDEIEKKLPTYDQYMEKVNSMEISLNKVRSDTINERMMSALRGQPK